MPVVGGVIYVDRDATKFTVTVRDDCPPDKVYFLPRGSVTWNLETGETLELSPGYYVNPRRLGVITNVK